MAKQTKVRPRAHISVPDRQAAIIKMHIEQVLVTTYTWDILGLFTTYKVIDEYSREIPLVTNGKD